MDAKPATFVFRKRSPDKSYITYVAVVTNNKLERRAVVAAIFVRIFVDFLAGLRYMSPEIKKNGFSINSKSARVLKRTKPKSAEG